MAPLLNYERLYSSWRPAIDGGWESLEPALVSFAEGKGILDMVYGCCDDRMWRKVISRRHLIKGGASLVALGLAAPLARQTTLGQVATPAATPAPSSEGRLPVLDVLFNPIFNGSFISPAVDIIGDVEIGERCFVASNTILYAQEGMRISLGNENNCQDNAYVLASESNLHFGDMVSIAHQAVVEDSVIGDFTFFGFRSRVRRSEIGEGTMVMHNTTVEDVVIPPGRITPAGVRITTQAEADALPELTVENDQFKEEVQGVNLEFVDGYTALYQERGRAGLEGVTVNPLTSWNPEHVEPQLADDVFLEELVRIVGDVRIGPEGSVGQRTAICADEGTPIIIGRRARIESRTTFHALKGTRIDIGDNVRIGDGNVIHGPVSIGDNFISEDNCVVFNVTVGNNVVVRTGATVTGEITIHEGSIVPEGFVVQTQEEADDLPQQ